MSNLEKRVQAIDELSAKRKGIQQVPNIDFVKYLHQVEAEHSNVKQVSDFKDDVLVRMDGLKQSGASMPWVKTHDNIRFRPSEVSMWQGFNGHKKSMILGYISLGFIQQNEPVCIASFEMKPSSTINRMLKQATGCANPTEYALDKFIDFTQDKLFLYDKQGSVSPETLYGVIYYCAKELGVKHFIIDSLMRVIAGEDDYNAQKDFVSKICGIALDTGIHIHLVHHNRKGDEGKPAGRYGAKGSGSLSDNVHNALEVHQPPRKDEADDDMPTNFIYCDKQREGEWVGCIALWFDSETLQFKGSKDAGVRAWIR